MKVRFPHPTPSLVVATVALVVALGGTSAAAVYMTTADNARHLGGKPPTYYLPAQALPRLIRHFASSQGDRFLQAGQTVTLGRTGHFTFTATCSHDSTGQNQVSFDVTADTTADLDGNGPMPAGTTITIHQDSDALDSTSSNPLNPGDFAQVGSASSSTEIAADGEELDIFYNDGVNWQAGNGSPAHDCFAGYTGLAGGFPN
jgi:hypothetical protein